MCSVHVGKCRLCFAGSAGLRLLNYTFDIIMYRMSRQDSTKKPSRYDSLIHINKPSHHNGYRSSGSKRDSRGSINAGSAATSGQTGGPRRSHSGPDKHRERQSALELASSMSRPGSSSSSKGAEGKTVSVLKRPAPDALSEEEVEKKASLLIAEFCQNVDYQVMAVICCHVLPVVYRQR